MILHGEKAAIESWLIHDQYMKILVLIAFRAERQWNHHQLSKKNPPGARS